MNSTIQQNHIDPDGETWTQAWEWPCGPSALAPCLHCPQTSCKVSTYYGKHASRAAYADNNGQVAALRVTEDIPTGTAIMSLRSGMVSATWPRSD